jgi:hypothetical protein
LAKGMANHCWGPLERAYTSEPRVNGVVEVSLPLLLHHHCFRRADVKMIITFIFVFPLMKKILPWRGGVRAKENAKKMKA